jgi:transposase-like protein
MAKEDKPETRTIKTRTGPTEKQNITRFICKVCGDTFDDQDVLRQHVATMHEQKGTVIATEVIQKAFGGRKKLSKNKSRDCRGGGRKQRIAAA